MTNVLDVGRNHVSVRINVQYVEISPAPVKINVLDVERNHVSVRTNVQNAETSPALVKRNAQDVDRILACAHLQMIKPNLLVIHLATSLRVYHPIVWRV